MLVGCLPILFACNMATNSSPDKEKTVSDTTESIALQAPSPVTDVQPQLQAITWSGIQEMTDETFKSQVLASSSLTLVDFNADWCGPCKRLKPSLDKLVKQYSGKLNFASVNVDECPETARYYQISLIPTLAFFQNARQSDTAIGLETYNEVKRMIDEKLQKGK